MLNFSLRLTGSAFIALLILLASAQAAGRMLPAGQIIPIVTYNSPTLMLVDVNRRVAANRRTNAQVMNDATVAPDQQHIAFSTSDGSNLHVYVSDLFGSHVQRLTSEDMGGENVAWSPDSQQVAFIGLETDNKRGIYTVAADGTSAPETILKAGTYASPSWSSDGQAITFAQSRYRDLANVYVVGSGCRLRCDRETLQITDTLVIDTAPVWSPDGTQIAFLSDRGGDYEIYLLNTTCMQPEARPCRLLLPHHLLMKPLVIPFLIIWSSDSSEVFFRGRDVARNEPGLYSVKADCYLLVEGCRPRLIYNLARSVSRKPN